MSLAKGLVLHLKYRKVNGSDFHFRKVTLAVGRKTGWRNGVGQIGHKATGEMAGAEDFSALPTPLTPTTWSTHWPVSLLPTLASLCQRAFPCPCFAATLQTPQQVKSDDWLELGYKHLCFLTPWVGEL